MLTRLRKVAPPLLILIIAVTFMATFAFADAPGAPGAPASQSVPVAAKIIAIAALISALIQGVKKLLDQVKISVPGWVALIINIVATVAVSVASADVGQVQSSSFWMQVVVGVVTSAGFHDLLNFAQGKHG